MISCPVCGHARVNFQTMLYLGHTGDTGWYLLSETENPVTLCCSNCTHEWKATVNYQEIFEEILGR